LALVVALQAILQSGDQYLIAVLYSTLVDVGADDDLLAHPSPALELYLRQEGGLGGQVGLRLLSLCEQHCFSRSAGQEQRALHM
jgi:hypothetical protein